MNIYRGPTSVRWKAHDHKEPLPFLFSWKQTINQTITLMDATISTWAWNRASESWEKAVASGRKWHWSQVLRGDWPALAFLHVPSSVCDPGSPSMTRFLHPPSACTWTCQGPTQTNQNPPLIHQGIHQLSRSLAMCTWHMEYPTASALLSTYHRACI